MMNILEMPYYRNYHAMSGNNAKAGHEVAVDIEIAKAARQFSQLSIELLLNLTSLIYREMASRNKLAEVTS